jgi:hypothetical protein
MLFLRPMDAATQRHGEQQRSKVGKTAQVAAGGLPDVRRDLQGV